MKAWLTSNLWAAHVGGWSMITEEIHPLRWRKITPNSDSHIGIARRAGGNLRNRQMVELITEFAQRDYQVALEDIPTSARPSFHRAGKKASELAIFASRFFALGQNMFEISPDLGHSLGASDLGDIRFNDLKFPYKFFWLSLRNLGLDERLDGEPNIIDGVYVDTSVSEVATLIFTTKRLGVSHDRALWPCNVEDHFLIGLRKLPGNPTFKEVLDDSISVNFTKLKVGADQRTFDRPGYTYTGIDSDGNREYIEHASGRTVVDVGMRNERQQVERNINSMPAVERALRKAANVLAYLSMAPAERSQVERYPDDAPQELIDQSSRGLSSGARQRAAMELQNQGFSKISIIGLSAAALQKRQAEVAGRELEFSHTRRGHFKTQAYGPKGSLRKTIWVEDTEVRPDLPMRQTHGHQYVLKPGERLDIDDGPHWNAIDDEKVNPDDDNAVPGQRF